MWCICFSKNPEKKRKIYVIELSWEGEVAVIATTEKEDP